MITLLILELDFDLGSIRQMLNLLKNLAGKRKMNAGISYLDIVYGILTPDDRWFSITINLLRAKLPPSRLRRELSTEQVAERAGINRTTL